MVQFPPFAVLLGLTAFAAGFPHSDIPESMSVATRLGFSQLTTSFIAS